MAERGELPVEHGRHPRLRRMHDEVARAEVAVDERGGVVARQVRGQPLDQPLHRLEPLGLRGAVLRGPAVDLPAEVIAGLAVVAEADRCVVHRVQARQHVVHRVVDGRPLDGTDTGQLRVREHAAVHAVHHVERGADDAVVLAQRVGARHRHRGAAQRGDHAVLAVDGVGGGQQLARRLAPQHELATAGGEVIRRIGLPAAKLSHLDGAAEVGDPLAQVALEGADVEAVLLANVRGLGDHPRQSRSHTRWQSSCIAGFPECESPRSRRSSNPCRRSATGEPNGSCRTSPRSSCDAATR